MMELFNKANLLHIIGLIHQHAREILVSLSQFHKNCPEEALLKEEQKYLEKIDQYAQQVIDDTANILDDAVLKHTNKAALDAYFKKICHDLRNHINTIIGYSEILLEDQESKDKKLDTKTFENIIQNAREILSALNQLRAEQAVVAETKATVDSLGAKSEVKHPADMDTMDVLSQIDTAERSAPASAETPTAQGLAKGSTEQVEPSSLGHIEWDDFKKEFSILIVDDVPDNCLILKQHLLKMGYSNIHMAGSAMEAKQEMTERTVDLLLLDITMPEISGIALLEELQPQIVQSQLMVLMITGADTLENAIQCIKLGAEDFLTKPINIEMLRVRIGACINKKWFHQREKKYAHQIELEKKRYESLLHAIFPSSIVEELTRSGQVTAKNYEHVATLFVGVVDFTKFCEGNEIEVAMAGIQDFSEICENAALKYNLQKIKTIGDGFLATAGMLTHHENPVLDCVRCALEIFKNSKNSFFHWALRAGIDYGTVVGGIVGHRQYLFDVWGDSVNTASRVQAISKPGKISLTKNAWDNIETLCEGSSMGYMLIKGKPTPMELFEFKKMV